MQLLLLQSGILGINTDSLTAVSSAPTSISSCSNNSLLYARCVACIGLQCLPCQR